MCRDFDEMNIVWYDPSVVTVAEMDRALSEAGTYLGTVEVGEAEK